MEAQSLRDSEAAFGSHVFSQVELSFQHGTKAGFSTECVWTVEKSSVLNAISGFLWAERALDVLWERGLCTALRLGQLSEEYAHAPTHLQQCSRAFTHMCIYIHVCKETPMYAVCVGSAPWRGKCMNSFKPPGWLGPPSLYPPFFLFFFFFQKSI